MKNKLVQYLSSLLLIVFILAAFAVPGFSYRSDPVRVVKAKVVVDRMFATQSDWKARVDKYFSDAADGMLTILNVRLQITDYHVWNNGRISEFGELRTAMINDVEKGEAEILIGFTLVRGSGKQQEIRKDGLAIARRGFMAKVYRGNEDQNLFLPFVIIHEMVHIFGGVHVFDGTIMSPIFNKDIELTLDPLNCDIISITRKIDFESGYASLSNYDLSRLARLYRRATHQGNQEMSTYLELGEIYNQLGEYDNAIQAFRQVTRQDQSAAYAWREIGDCYRRAGNIDKAIATFERAVNKVEEKGVFLAKLAVIYYNRGQYEISYDKALSARRFGSEVDPALWVKLKKQGIP